MVEKSPRLLHVLIVDDESLILWSITETLSGVGWEVAEARNAKEALQHLSAASAPDVILLDYRLPDSSDLRLLETIRRVAPKSPVIMMTAYGTREMQDGALALGAHRVLSKPIDIKDLIPLVEEAYERKFP
jgi:DNA-binding NtrC family response regulator